MYEDTNEIKVEIDTKWDEIVSPKLFTLVLKDTFKNFHWEGRGLNILEERLNKLIIFTQNKAEVQETLHKLQLGVT